MEHMSKTEALKNCADYIFDNDQLWENLEWDVNNYEIHELWNRYHEGSELYWAAVALDRVEKYLEVFHEKLEEAGKTRNVKMCRDCFDFAIAEDCSVLENFVFYHGEEEGQKVYEKVKSSVGHIEKDGTFLYEVPELINRFSIYACECCGSKLHGERFFMVYNVNEEVIYETRRSSEIKSW